jgi:hypothetical protein
MRARAREQIVVEDVPAIHDRQQPRCGIALPHRAEPVAPRAAARREAVPVLDVAAGHELLAGVTVSDAAELREGDVARSWTYAPWSNIGGPDSDGSRWARHASAQLGLRSLSGSVRVTD